MCHHYSLTLFLQQDESTERYSEYHRLTLYECLILRSNREHKDLKIGWLECYMPIFTQTHTPEISFRIIIHPHKRTISMIDNLKHIKI